MKRVVCFFDGCCEPKNPGGAMGTGSIVKVDGDIVFSKSSFYSAVPTNTNNISEYIAFGLVLKYILDNNLDGDDVTIMGDSQLVVNQMGGSWSIKEGAYKKYAFRCKELLKLFKKKPTIFWIKRDQNEEADQLSKSELSVHDVAIKTHSDKENTISFGKYSGQQVCQINDLQYLQWALKTVKLKPKMRGLIQSRISYLSK